MSFRHPRDPATVALLAIVTIIATMGAVLVGIVHSGADVEAGVLFLAIMAVVGPTVPAIIAAFFSTRASHDIRNHVLTDKVREGVIEGYPEAVDKLAEDVFHEDDEARHKRKDEER